MKAHFFVYLIFLFISQNTKAQFQWPDGKKAAVVFTYDDALDGHLDVAVPQLDEFGFKGTFFCTGNSESLYKRMDDWREIAREGHELGNHTLFHPCSKSTNDWVKPEYDLETYSLTRMVDEMKTANTLLKAIDGKEQRTFAYTCCEYLAGDLDFSGEVAKLFEAARLLGPVPKTMNDYNIYLTPSSAVENPSAEYLIQLVEEAKTNGTIVVFLFHSVGGGYLNTGAEEHHNLLRYVHAHCDELFTGTFMEVMSYIKNHR